MDPIQYAKPQRLQCRNPIVQKKFKSTYISFMETHSMITRVLSLVTTSDSHQWNGNEEDKWEALGNLRKQGVHQATEQCRKICDGQVDWNPKANIMRAEVHLWRLCAQRAQCTKKLGRSYHWRVQAEARMISVDIPDPIQAIVAIFQQTRREWCAFAKHHA
jgi:hypothetical protein